MNAQSTMEFLKSFCINENDMRNMMKKVNYYDNGWFAATDSHILAMSNNPELDKTDCLNSEIAIWAVLEKHEKRYIGEAKPTHYINLSDIHSIFSEIHALPEMVDKYEECEECDGVGSTECNCCGQDVECEWCDGEGEIKCGEKETGYYKYPEDVAIQICNVRFRLTIIHKILESLKLIEVDRIEIFGEHHNDMQIFFKIPNENIYLLVMGTLWHEETTSHKIQIHQI